ncbi:very short patch repair endonuclease [Burkholderia ambifaria]|uniref:very short patch repair endonuclease n=1 Tax=Burkholderia ambifaria TaxID=152480 RepID=UPI001B970C49|nr:DNA mismatch endonuclease Vsr [Burkholderia ambifaria]MBR8225433.1 DNA mismatch endonuclease Vsr [Burkholderia ambifaria]
MDIVSKPTRSRMMAGIRSKNTQPEMVVRRSLHAAGFRFRLHRRDLPGSPDLVLPKHRAVILVHGCFWHLHEGCRFATTPASNSEFWREKLTRNRERDLRQLEALKSLGWRVLVVWECATRAGELKDNLQQELVRWLDGSEEFGELPAAPTAPHQSSAKRSRASRV